MKEFRILDHGGDSDRYFRFEVQERTRFFYLFWGWWMHSSAFILQDSAIEYVQKLEDFYSSKGPTEIYRVRVK